MNPIDLDFSKICLTGPHGKWLFTGKIGICTSSEKVHEVLICMKGNTLCEKEILRLKGITRGALQCWVLGMLLGILISDCGT